MFYYACDIMSESSVMKDVNMNEKLKPFLSAKALAILSTPPVDNLRHFRQSSTFSTFFDIFDILRQISTNRQSSTKLDKTRQSSTKLDKAQQNSTKEQTNEDKTDKGLKLKHTNSTKLDKTRQSSTKLDKTRQTRQMKTKRDSRPWGFTCL